MSLFPGPRDDGLCLGLNFNISKVGYSFLLKVHAFLQVDFLEDEFQCTKKQKKKQLYLLLPFTEINLTYKAVEYSLQVKRFKNTETVQQITSKSDSKKG